MAKFPLTEVIKVQKLIGEIYYDWALGLVAVTSDYVHVQPSTLAEISDPHAWTVTDRRDHGEFEAQAAVTIDGVQFIALGSKAEIAALKAAKEEAVNV